MILFNRLSKFVIAMLSGVLVGVLVPGKASPGANSLKPNEEMRLTQTCENVISKVRLADDFVCADLSIQQITLVARAPLWTVQVISRKKGLYFEAPLKEWLRRGCPLNFFRFTEIPQWPLIANGEQQFLKREVGIMTLPYLTKQHQVVPIETGNAGHLLVLKETVPVQAAKIMSTFYQTPLSDSYPLQLHIRWKPHQSSKLNDVLLYSTAANGPDKTLDTTEISIGQKQPIPTTVGLKLSKDQGSIWTDHSDVDGLGQLIR